VVAFLGDRLTSETPSSVEGPVSADFVQSVYGPIQISSPMCTRNVRIVRVLMKTCKQVKTTKLQ